VHSRRYELKLQLNFTSAAAAAAASGNTDTQQQTSEAAAGTADSGSDSSSSSSTLVVLLFPPIGGGLSPTARGWNYEPYPRQAPMVSSNTYSEHDGDQPAQLPKHTLAHQLNAVT
jgi:hypothetical protein